MNLEIAKYKTKFKVEFLGSSSANWLSELVNQSTLNSFSNKHKLPEIGRELMREVDYENMSGVSNPNLCEPERSLIYLEALIDLYKSDALDFKKLYNSQTGKPLTDGRVFIDGKMINLTLEYYNGFTLEQFYKLKGFEYNEGNLRIYEVNDKYDNDEHIVEQGNILQIEIRNMNQFETKANEIRKTIEFIQTAMKDGNYIQLVAV